MMVLSSLSATALRAQCTCPSQISSFGTFPKLTTLSGFVAVKRQRLQIRMLKGAGIPEVAGFGSQRAGGKAKHKILTLDPTRVEEVHKFDLFARIFAKDEPASKWEPIGEILVEKVTDLGMALKERRKRLLAAAQHQYPSFLMLSGGEEVQYGYRKAGEEGEGNDISLVDVKGKELDSSIPALLRVEDGVKPPPKRY